jgi:hypothetical protein
MKRYLRYQRQRDRRVLLLIAARQLHRHWAAFSAWVLRLLFPSEESDFYILALRCSSLDVESGYS